MNAGRPLAFGAALLALLFPPFAAGDEDPARPAPLELRLVPVSALTRGFTDFRCPRSGLRALLTVPLEESNPESVPLFGGEGEDSVKPYGTIDEIIEILRARNPTAWSASGVSLNAAGTQLLVLRAPKDVLDAAEALLSEMEQEALRTLVVDLLVLEGDPTAVGEAGGVASAIARGDLRIVGAARTSAHPGQQMAASSGRETAFLADQDVEIADEKATADPIVETAMEGVGFTAVPRATDGGLRLDVHAWFSRMESLERLETAATDSVERPTLDVRTADASLLAMEPGVWRPVGSSGRITFAVRAIVRASAPPPRTAALPGLPPTGPSGPLSFVVRDVSDLAQRFPSTMGSRVYLAPSNYTPPEPPELPEPTAYVEPDMVEELAKALVDPDSWTRAPADLSRYGSRLELRADATHVAAVDALLAHLRRRFLRAYRVDALVLSMPAASLPGLLAQEEDAFAAPAGSRVEARSTVRFASGGRTAADQGVWRRYLGDYDVEIAAKATIGNPIVKSVLEGVVLDAGGVPVSGGAALDVALRFDRSSGFVTRHVATRHGDLECPRMAIQTTRGNLVVPIGGTRLASIAVDGDRATLVFLSAAVD